MLITKPIRMSVHIFKYILFHCTIWINVKLIHCHVLVTLVARAIVKINYQFPSPEQRIKEIQAQGTLWYVYNPCAQIYYSLSILHKYASIIIKPSITDIPNTSRRFCRHGDIQLADDSFLHSWMYPPVADDSFIQSRIWTLHSITDIATAIGRFCHHEYTYH